MYTEHCRSIEVALCQYDPITFCQALHLKVHRLLEFELLKMSYKYSTKRYTSRCRIPGTKSINFNARHTHLAWLWYTCQIHTTALGFSQSPSGSSQLLPALQIAEEKQDRWDPGSKETARDSNVPSRPTYTADRFTRALVCTTIIIRETPPWRKRGNKKNDEITPARSKLEIPAPPSTKWT